MNRLALKLRFCAAFLLLGLWGADAQTAREQIAAVPERAGGIYHSYEYRAAAAAPAPDGTKRTGVSGCLLRMMV